LLRNLYSAGAHPAKYILALSGDSLQRRSAIVMAILLAIPSSSKDKKKPNLPAGILRAQFVAVVVDPDAGIIAHESRRERDSAADVEVALQKWGRFKTTLNAPNSDLIFVTLAVLTAGCASIVAIYSPQWFARRPTRHLES